MKQNTLMSCGHAITRSSQHQ